MNADPGDDSGFALELMASAMSNRGVMDPDTALMLLKSFGASPLVEGLSIMEAGAMPNASLENTLAHARTTEARIQQGNDGLAKALNKVANGISKGGLATALGNASAATDQAPSNEGPPSVAQDNTVVVQGNGHGASQAQVGEQGGEQGQQVLDDKFALDWGAMYGGETEGGTVTTYEAEAGQREQTGQGQKRRVESSSGLERGHEETFVIEPPDAGPREVVEHQMISSSMPVRRSGWRKYGQKKLSNDMVRSYYRCSVPGCAVKRQVVMPEGASGGMAQVRTIGEHTHVDDIKEEFVEIFPQDMDNKRRRVQPDGAATVQDGVAAATNGTRDASTIANPVVDVSFAQRMMSAIPAFVIADPTKPDITITCITPGFSAMTGYTGADVIGRSFRLLQGTGTDPDTIRNLETHVAHRTAGHNVCLLYKKTGHPFWCLVNSSPVNTANGSLLATILQLIDVSRSAVGPMR